MSDSLSMWVIYDHPKDYPGHFVVRRHESSARGSRATMDFSLHETLEEARAAVPFWTHRLDRFPGDEPQIVEVWL